MSGHSSSDPKESFAQRVIMVEWESGMPLGANLFGANACFKRDVLWIPTSDLDKGQEEHTIGSKERSSASPMCVFIMSAEICG